jgi:CheY-like chemotaxis protein
VEDEIAYADLIIELFNEHEDCVVHHARDGVEALQFLEAGFMPSIILSDLRMPRMDGHVLLETVKRSRLFRDIPFVIYSSKCCSEMERKVHGCPTMYHFSKPVGIREIRAMLNRILLLGANQAHEPPVDRPLQLIDGPYSLQEHTD